MTQTERREFLISALLKEDVHYAEFAIPRECEKQRRLLRSLMNVRSPKAISPEFLEVQDRNSVKMFLFTG